MASQDKILDLMASMGNMDENVEYTQQLRKSVVDKLTDVIQSIDLNDVSKDAELFESYSSFIGQYRQYLNDIDSTAAKQVSIKLKQRDLDQQKENSINICELLSKVKIKEGEFIFREGEINEQEMEDKLKQRFGEIGGEILDTELELGGNSLPKYEEE